MPHSNDQGQQPAIIAAVIKAMQHVEAVGKRGKNKEQGFAYRKYDDIVTCANAALAHAGIAVFPNVISVERETAEVNTKNSGRKLRTRTIVHVRYEFTATDGSVKAADVYGEADDYGDKSLGKAMTYAHKLALIQVLNIPVADMDPDEFSHEGDKVIGRGDEPEAAAPKRRQRPEPKPRQPRTESAPGLMEKLRGLLAPFLADPIEAGGADRLREIWSEVEGHKTARRLIPADYNELSELVKAIRDDLGIPAKRAASATTISHNPDAPADDPWADAPTQGEYLAARDAMVAANEQADRAALTEAAAAELEGDYS